MQDVIEPVHVYVAAGCHPNRRTEELLHDSALVVERLEHDTMPRSLPSGTAGVLGAARKP